MSADGAERRRELIRRAAALVRERDLVGGSSAGRVGAALLAADGNVYGGVCVDLPSGMGWCAEVAAAAAMVTTGETRVEADRVDAVRDRVVEAMEGALELEVPLVADAGSGRSWYDAKG